MKVNKITTCSNPDCNRKPTEFKFLCSRCYHKDYRAKNKEKISQNIKRFKDKNREKIRKEGREYYHKRAELLKKEESLTGRTPDVIIYEHNYRRTVQSKYSRLKSLANKKGLGFNISKEQFFLLLDKLCFYCEGELSETGYSLDRMDNSRGYLIDNVATCCKRCNWIKGSYLSFEEMVIVGKCLKDFRLKKKENA